MNNPFVPFRLGVTGGIGSGKSTVCSVLRDLGAEVFSADEVGKRILEQDSDARSELADAFGPGCLTPEGKLDARRLAGRVFGHPEKLEALNAIVHPRVAEAFEAACEQAALRGAKVIAKEAALIFETGAEKRLDSVLVVDAPEAVRLRRGAERLGVEVREVKRRADCQLPAEELRKRADYVIDNTGSLEALREKTERFFRSLLDSLSRRR